MAYSLLKSNKFQKLLLFLTFVSYIHSQNSSQEEYFDYDTEGLELDGFLSIAGSDTMLEVMDELAKEFNKLFPEVVVHVEGKGSATAIDALVNETSRIGAMVRLMNENENQRFWDKFKYEPVMLRLSMDANVFVVNHKNPLGKISLENLNQIITQQNKCSNKSSIYTWGELFESLPNENFHMAYDKADFIDRPIILAGKSNLTGTYSLIINEVLCGGEFRSNAHIVKDYDAIIEEVSSDIFKIGYISFSHKTDKVKILSILNEQTNEYVAPNEETIGSRLYPLSRYSFIYVNRDPFRDLPDTLLQWLAFTMTKQGQDIVKRNNLITIKPSLCKLQLYYIGAETYIEKNRQIVFADQLESQALPVYRSFFLLLLCLLL